MIKVDVSVFMQIANFLFLIWALNIVLYKPIRKVLLERKEKVEGLEQGIENLNINAQEKEDAFTSGIKDARSKGQIEKELLLSAAQNEEKQLLEKINKKAQDDLAQMRDKIATEAENVRISLQNEVDVFANAIGQKILGRVF
ncbi:MAG: ATP synthase F0 subunit B [Pseudomonadota bacterium]|nr:ATP synthase F0 subunit B [Pseudomonadota bacterium]MBU1397527.1 ATP synthase F0 subunit B [Pseudomonadota bacterium]MBU1569397.1 ATP synthase F0 subunit B [Pseudomonadota bacterium]